MRDWLPDRATPKSSPPQPSAPRASLPAPSTETKTRARTATAGKDTDPVGTRRASHRAKRAGPPGRT
jgi:hypothetical protein